MKKNINDFKYNNHTIFCECGCGSFLNKFDQYGRSRSHIRGHNSRDVSVKKNFLHNIGDRTSIDYKNLMTEVAKKKLSNLYKGKSLEERYGKEKSENIKRKISKNYKYSFTEDPINKIKLIRSQQILPRKDTKIEIKIQMFLKELGITFFTHQYMSQIKHAYQCDILIPSLNLVIECDGDYWHKYPTGTIADHIRTKELIDNGFKVLRLWEKEIKMMNIKDFEKRVIQ